VFTQRYIAYQVINCTPRCDYFVLFLRIGESKLHDEFNLFSRRLISSHKGRYKVDVKGVCSSIMSKAHEHLLVSRSNTIDIFLDEFANPKYVFHSASAKALFEELSVVDGKSEDILQGLLRKDVLISDAQASDSELYYMVSVAKRINNAGYRAYSSIMSDDESVMHLFSVMHGRDSAMMFRVEMVELKEKDFNRTSSLPASVTDGLTPTLTEAQRESLSRTTSTLKYILRLTPVNSEQVTGLSGVERCELNQTKIARFALPALSPQPFLLLTPIRMTFGSKIVTNIKHK